MGVIEKALAFVKKHWETGDDVFPEDLNRYEDGIDDLGKQIGVLSDKITHGVVDNLDFDSYRQEGITIIGLNCTGTLPPNQTAEYLRHGILRISKTAMGVIQEIFTANDIAYGVYGGKYYHRNIAKSPQTNWKEIATVDQITVLTNTKVDKSSYYVKDFNNIPVDERFIKSGPKIPNAPGEPQFVGLQTSWDDAFRFTIGGDLAGRFWARKSKDNWKQLATTDKIDTLQLMGGWKKISTSYEAFENISKAGNTVILNGILTGGNGVGGTIIATLPVGYRPLRNVIVSALCCNTDFVFTPCTISINNDGNIVCDMGIDRNYRLVINANFSV